MSIAVSSEMVKAAVQETRAACAKYETSSLQIVCSFNSYAFASMRVDINVGQWEAT